MPNSLRPPRILLAAVAVSLSIGAAACSDDNGQTGVLELAESGAGTCLQVPDTLGAEVASLPVIDCAEPHTHEIYSVVPYDQDDVYPGKDKLSAFAEQVCLRDFQPYVGISNFDSSLTFTWLTPTLDSWNEDDDRDILCVLADGLAAPLTGSMKGSNR